jgi:hypothetical protein
LRFLSFQNQDVQPIDRTGLWREDLTCLCARNKLPSLHFWLLRDGKQMPEVRHELLATNKNKLIQQRESEAPAKPQISNGSAGASPSRIAGSCYRIPKSGVRIVGE